MVELDKDDGATAAIIDIFPGLDGSVQLPEQASIENPEDPMSMSKAKTFATAGMN